MSEIAESNKAKLLVIGNIRGQFEAVFTRLNALHRSKGPFLACLAVGQLFEDEDEDCPDLLEQCPIELELPLYCIVSGNDRERITRLKGMRQGGTLAKNVHYLGQCGLMSLKEDGIGTLNIAYLTGRFDEKHFLDANHNSDDSDPPSKFYRKSELQCFAKEQRTIHVLLTSELGRGWHNAIDRGLDSLSLNEDDSRKVMKDCRLRGSQIISKLAVKLKPRYHFSADAIISHSQSSDHTNDNDDHPTKQQQCYFIQIKPYLNSSTQTLTRLISLGEALESTALNRGMYAFSLDLSEQSNPNLSNNTHLNVEFTPNPYTLGFTADPSRNSRSLKRGLSHAQGSDDTNDDDSTLRRVVTNRGGPKMARMHPSNHQRRAFERFGPSSHAASAPGGGSTAAGTGGLYPGYICHKCGIPGHLIQECPEILAERRAKYGDRAMIMGKRPDQSGVSVTRDEAYLDKFGGRRLRARRFRDAPFARECWFCLSTLSKNNHNGSNHGVVSSSIVGSGASAISTMKKSVISESSSRNAADNRHLIVSVSAHVYLSLPKGALMTGLGQHLLLVPIQHIDSSSRLNTAVKSDMQKYLFALNHFARREQGDRSVIVCDRNLKTSSINHCYFEVFTLERSLVDSGRLAQVLNEEASKHQLKFHAVGKGESMPRNSGFGTLKMFVFGSDTKYVCSLPSAMIKVPLNFLRRVIAVLIGQPERTEWTACIREASETRSSAAAFKSQFRRFDWTMRRKTLTEKGPGSSESGDANAVESTEDTSTTTVTVKSEPVETQQQSVEETK